MIIIILVIDETGNRTMSEVGTKLKLRNCEKIL